MESAFAQWRRLFSVVSAESNPARSRRNGTARMSNRLLAGEIPVGLDLVGETVLLHLDGVAFGPLGALGVLLDGLVHVVRHARLQRADGLSCHATHGMRSLA